MITELINLLCGFFSGNIPFFACYINGGGSFPPALSQNEENLLVEKLAQGDENARNLLIEHNLRLVAHIAKKYSGAGQSTDDLLSIGTIGLIKGVSAYSPDRRTRLSTFLAKCIQNEILMYFRSGKRSRNEVSLSDALGSDSEGNELTFQDIISDEDESVINEVSLHLQIKMLYEKIGKILDKREAYIICHRYGLGGIREKTQNEIAETLGISRSYVSRIEKKALEKLRESTL